MEKAASIAPLGVARAILYGAAVVGVCDFAYASLRAISRGNPWFAPWQAVASALLGRDAFSGGQGTVLFGIFLHFVVAACIVAVYVLASRHIPVLTRRIVLCGLAYGVLAFLVMNWVVIPLTRIGRVPSFTTSGLVGGLLIHLFGVGLPAAYFARRAARSRG